MEEEWVRETKSLDAEVVVVSNMGVAFLTVFFFFTRLSRGHFTEESTVDDEALDPSLEPNPFQDGY